jgi:nucleoside-diphosphate-sugar epimerase
MRIFVAGATGVVGRRLVPALVAAGYEVTGTTRTESKTGLLRQLGADPVVVDGLDAAALEKVITQAAPEAIVHQMTALAGRVDLKHFDRTFGSTNALRTIGTDNLLAAARTAGVPRIIVQSFTGWPNERVGGPVKTEDDPLDPDPPAQQRQTMAAIRHLEQVVLAAPLTGVVLRYGMFYGPGTSEEMLDLVRKDQHRAHSIAKGRRGSRAGGRRCGYGSGSGRGDAGPRASSPTRVILCGDGADVG